MAREMTVVMARLGYSRFGVAGHDRGGRVAYRLALDHPGSVAAVAVLDVLPVAEAWTRADDRFALGYWPWSLLAQDAPLPERLITGAPDEVVDSALAGWGSHPDVFDGSVRAAYVEALRDEAHVHAICEEYRAAARRVLRAHGSSPRHRCASGWSVVASGSARLLLQTVQLDVGR
jgi:haloacetate dehalogenase